jgi:hypothetical protein
VKSDEKGSDGKESDESPEPAHPMFIVSINKTGTK